MLNQLYSMLNDLFGINSNDLFKVNNTVSQSNEQREFERNLAEALEDEKITKKEFNHLESRAEELGLGKHYVQEALQKELEKRTKSIIDDIENLQRFSPDDEATIIEIAKNLHASELSFPGEWTIYRNLWEYENNGTMNLSPIKTSIILTKGEFCFFHAYSIWAQTEYGEMSPISNGDIYITNKKILFDGDMKSTSITMGKIVGIQVLSEGLEIRKTSGKADFFTMEEVDAEYASAILHSILNEQLTIA